MKDDTKYMYLEQDIIGWAKVRGIFATGTRDGQAKKMLEEAGEVVVEVAKGSQLYVAKEIGDVLVTCILLAEMYGFTTDDCLSAAWDTIKNRKGKMVDGQFVREK